MASQQIPSRESDADLYGITPVEYGLATSFVVLSLVAAMPGLAIALHAAVFAVFP